MSVLKNKTIILQFLYNQHKINSLIYISNKDIQSATDLSSVEINDAIVLLHKDGNINILKAPGTAPYQFAYAKILPEGVKKVEQFAEQQLISEDDVDNYDVFVCYYCDTGTEEANHLYKGLTDAGYKVFLDSKVSNSIKEKYKFDWEKYIDSAILHSKYVFLIMTLNFNNRPQVIRELQLASDNKINIVHFKKDCVNEDTQIILKNIIYKIKNKDHISFNKKYDLLEKALNYLDLKPDPCYSPLFNSSQSLHYNLNLLLRSNYGKRKHTIEEIQVALEQNGIKTELERQLTIMVFTSGMVLIHEENKDKYEYTR